MSEETARESAPPIGKSSKKRSVKFWVILALAAVFVIGMGYEVFRHSDGVMRSRFDKYRESFEYVNDYLQNEDSVFPEEFVTKIGKGGKAGIDSFYLPTDAGLENAEEFNGHLDVLADKCGVRSISAAAYTGTDEKEIRFYIDINVGYSYFPEACRDRYSYFPQDYFEQSELEGEWYIFGKEEREK